MQERKRDFNKLDLKERVYCIVLIGFLLGVLTTYAIIYSVPFWGVVLFLSVAFIVIRAHITDLLLDFVTTILHKDGEDEELEE